MKVFFLIWIGQFLSIIGSALTRFSLGVWVYQSTGSNTQFSLILLFGSLAFVLVSPFAGMLVDRWNRFWTMVMSDLAASFCTLAIAFLTIINGLEVWHIYLTTALIAVFSSFQNPAYMAFTTLLVPSSQLTRANAMMQVGVAGGQLIAPALAGFLLISIKLKGIVIIDYLTFLFAMITLWSVRFAATRDNDRPKLPKEQSKLKEILQGWNYIVERRGLLALLIFMTITNVVFSPIFALVTPLILSFASSSTLGMILSFSGLGMLLSSVLLSIWGGPKRLMNALFLFTFLSGLFVLGIGLRPSTALVTVSVFLAACCQPFFLSCNRVIFQKKSPPNLQGRVFACYSTFMVLFLPISYGIIGPLVDQVLEPAMAVDGILASSIGRIIGVGQGRGLGLMFIIIGLINMIITVTFFFYKPLRLVEKNLPDVI